MELCYQAVRAVPEEGEKWPLGVHSGVVEVVAHSREGKMLMLKQEKRVLEFFL